jgi:hypothetical protein
VSISTLCWVESKDSAANSINVLRAGPSHLCCSLESASRFLLDHVVYPLTNCPPIRLDFVVTGGALLIGICTLSVVGRGL